MTTHNKIGRRKFLKTAGGAALGLAVAPTIIPASALGADGRPAPSNRLVMASIGVGSRGTENLRQFLSYKQVQVVAVCDVDRGHRSAAREIVEKKYADEAQSGAYKGCKEYNDFRDLCARGDIDAIAIATPDHWHAMTAIAAAKSGKDIYAEKPLSLTIAQGRAMSDTMKRYGTLFQTGSQQRSDRNFRFACELVRNERIGKLKTIRVGLPTGPTIGPQAAMPIPDGFDYDFWLGPAPEAPYTENRCFWNFRWILDYSGGQLTDWAAHHCDIAQWGMGTESTGPVSVEGKGEYPRDGLYNAATHYHFDCMFANGVKMMCGDDMRGGVTFEGSEGWVYVNRGEIEADPKGLLTTTIGPNEIHLYESQSQHMNFLECVRTRSAPIAPIETAHRSISIAHLGNIAMQLGRKVNWNPDIERFVNDPEADRMLSRSMRGSWHL